MPKDKETFYWPMTDDAVGNAIIIGPTRAGKSINYNRLALTENEVGRIKSESKNSQLTTKNGVTK